MDQRTKILAFALAGVVACWGVLTGGERYVTGPISLKNKQIEDANKRLKTLRDEQTRILAAQTQYNEWKSRSLPPEQIDAQRLYKDWLTALAEVVGFDGLQVEAGRREEKAVGRGRTKKDLYASVQVKLEGKTTFDRLNRFLYYFHRTKLMHRVSDLKIVSEGNEGDPMMKVTLSVEALAFVKAPKRSRLFPEADLIADATADSIQVNDLKGIPKKGEFHVRLGKDLLTVTGRDGKSWTVRGGIDPPADDPEQPILESADPSLHVKGDRVELTPMLPLPENDLALLYRDVFGPGKSPFVLPVPPVEYNPRWSGLRDQRITRRRGLQMRVKVVDLDPRKGTATISIGKSDLKSLKFDPKTGDIDWQPKDEDEAKEYSVELIAHQGGGEKPILTETLRITLTDPNRSPSLERISDKSVMIGQLLSFNAKATDPDEDDRQYLKFSLKDAPEGATIGSTSGEFSWTPGDSLEARDYTFTVRVTDGRRTDAKEDSRSVTVRLTEDMTRFVTLIGIVTEDGQRRALLYDISTKKETFLKEGSPFRIAGISGFIFVIGEDFIEYQASGKTWRMQLGTSLAERRLLPAPKRKAVAKKPPAKPKPVTNEKPVATKTVKPDSAITAKKPD